MKKYIQKMYLAYNEQQYYVQNQNVFEISKIN